MTIYMHGINVEGGVSLKTSLIETEKIFFNENAENADQPLQKVCLQPCVNRANCGINAVARIR